MTGTENHNHSPSPTWRIHGISKTILAWTEETGNAAGVRGTAGRDGHRKIPTVNKRRWLALAALLLTGLIALTMSGCIPVTVRPQFDDQGLPIALPVTPSGSVSIDGTLTPIYEVSSESPKPTNWAGIAVGISAFLNALLLAYGINLRGFASKAMTAIKIASDLADANAQAETDPDVERNKTEAAKRQTAAGVWKITQQARGKT